MTDNYCVQPSAAALALRADTEEIAFRLTRRMNAQAKNTPAKRLNLRLSKKSIPMKTIGALTVAIQGVPLMGVKSEDELNKALSSIDAALDGSGEINWDGLPGYPTVTSEMTIGEGIILAARTESGQAGADAVTESHHRLGKTRQATSISAKIIINDMLKAIENGDFSAVRYRILSGWITSLNNTISKVPGIACHKDFYAWVTDRIPEVRRAVGMQLVMRRAKITRMACGKDTLFVSEDRREEAQRAIDSLAANQPCFLPPDERAAILKTLRMSLVSRAEAFIAASGGVARKKEIKAHLESVVGQAISWPGLAIRLRLTGRYSAEPRTGIWAQKSQSVQRSAHP